ncbi:hypothetical protein SAMN04490243_2209 [Robiginitalea myxolifaciens]|uniref:Xylose isomerase-like TIM barrel n=1 Tax=Robiginitalea myxolifaciens TaxID=400055 RepID=A0A1I6H3S7_9FLAO|nr:metabolite traffic protein EboE [Robiginitalea myxolifaciens]SFR49084.1 hypothetical protein SAMN04490243_2209 [Robiginitalea myxolifaciens]
MFLGDQFHITYCTNIHPGESWEDTYTALKSNLPAIRRDIAAGNPMGVGLRLSDRASRELGEADKLEEFKAWLTREQLYVFTLNGFPFGSFHGTRVKDKVHHPDWTQPERLEYTLRLFRQLSRLLPDGVDGGISTSPISYRHWFETAEEADQALTQGARAMARVALLLHELNRDHGQDLHLDIEPEPDGLLENTAEVLRFFAEFLLPEGIPLLQQELGITAKEAAEVLKKHIAVCYDVCHFALAFEKPEFVFPRLEEAGIRTGKIQVSAALKIRFPSTKRQQVLTSLESFDEPVYLHQVTHRTDTGVATFNDLPAFKSALAQASEADGIWNSEFRAHFHVPIFASGYETLEATQNEIVEVLEYLKHHPVTNHLEVETYTWEVLPAGLKENLQKSIVRELHWLKAQLQS